MLLLIEKDVLNQHLKPYQSKNVCIYEILSHFKMMIKLFKIQIQKYTIMFPYFKKCIFLQSPLLAGKKRNCKDSFYVHPYFLMER